MLFEATLLHYKFIVFKDSILILKVVNNQELIN